MIDMALLLAFIDVESSFKTLAFMNDRNGGSYGLMQIDFPTACDRGYTGMATGLYDTATNIKYGFTTLRWIEDNLEQYGMRTVANIAAAYNSGLSNVLKGGTDPDYSNKILAVYKKYCDSLGLTPQP